MRRGRLLSAIAVLLTIVGTWPQPALAFFREGWKAGPVSLTFQNCPFGGSGGADGCGVSPGLFYAPAVGAIGSPPQPTTAPSYAQWQSYSATSGQTWHVAHAQTWNIAGVDPGYGVGPNQTLASMLDIAGWNTGSPGPASTLCVYMSAADGYNGTTGAGWTGTATGSGTTLTLNSTATGAMAIGMQIIPGPASVPAQLFIVAGSGTTWTTSRSFTHASESLSATNTYYGAAGGASQFQWVAGDPALVCGGATSVSDFSISGWNFGPTAFQLGTAVGSHDCVSLLLQPANVAYNPKETIINNAFINGTTCAPIIGGTRYGQISSQVNLQSSVKIWNNYFWGRNTDSCCIIPTNQGFPISIGKMQNTLDIQYNWAYQTGSGMAFVGFLTGNEAACANGTTYTYPGYTYITDHNYFDNYGTLYGGGHYELANLGGIQISCLIERNYNTVLIPSTMPNSVLGAFFGWGSSGQGVGEYNKVDNNTVVTNTVGGAPLPVATQFYNWYATGGTPNRIVITGTGSSCTSQCTNPTVGMGIAGGTGNTHNSVIGLETNFGSGPITGSSWRSGCAQDDGTGGSGLCPGTTGPCLASGNCPDLQPGVAIGSSGSPVLNSSFTTNTTSRTLASYDHGALGYFTGFQAGAGGPFTGTTVLTTRSSCPPQSAVGTSSSSGGYAGAILVDDTQSATVGMVTGTGCSGAPATFTLTANAAISVATNDNLHIAQFAYGTTEYLNNYLDNSGSLETFSAQPATNSGGSANGFSTGTGGGGCATPITATGNIDLVSGSTLTLTAVSGGC